MNLDNCPRCGKLYAKNLRDLCPACIKDLDQQYELCATYLRENRGATIYEVSESTEVSIAQITRFIREGRISLMDMPNMGYPCEMCTNTIREGNLCESCRSRLTKDINKLNLNTDRHGYNTKQGNGAYQSVDRHRDKY
ncbi:Flagellar operon protein YvyF [Paenibacillus curdlanolyticus YK9]|uniref:Flagellar operon protein YvyF n=1 Tax=Paenibacillus curdlanolyticus YK9 TaxID=717606 RepID=E0IED6_9BACL|nr:TIGR03826 family flagellar region protein [Paenibacillus curdlanolyticus]EFM09024.1 Flagellar operon protein YvyF [Paenibacillus curdlanolyticus YK9]